MNGNRIISCPIFQMFFELFCNFGEFFEELGSAWWRSILGIKIIVDICNNVLLFAVEVVV